MNITEPKNDTPTLYPFRLEEAKLNKGNVVTRDGKPAEYIGDSGAVLWPLKFKVNGAIKSYRYTSKGRFYSDHDEDCDDLFMTTPAPLPAQAPEEQSLEAQTILNLKKHLDRWRSNIRNVVLQGDKTPMDDDTLRDRAYTAIDTRVADERRLAKEANSRAESAEARVTALEGELAEERVESAKQHRDAMDARDKLMQTADQAEIYRLETHRWAEVSKKDAAERDGLWRRIRELEREIAVSPTPAWIPVSTRMPLAAEGSPHRDTKPQILWGRKDHEGSHYEVAAWDYRPYWATHWMTPIPFPPSAPPEEETERKAAKKAYDKYVEDAPNGRVASFDDFFIGWHAARQSAPTEV